MYDVIIVGGGPAGLSAALMLGRCRRRVLLYDLGEPRNHRSRALHGYLTRDGIAPLDFQALGRAELGQYGVEVRTTGVTGACWVEDHFQVTVDGQTEEQARYILLATGVVDDLPGVAGFADCYGLSVHHCPYCDGWEWRDRRLVAFGRGREGAGLALGLKAWTRDVVICTNGSRLDRAVRDQLGRNAIAIRTEPIARLEHTDGMVRAVRFERGAEEPCDAVFFATGQHPQSPLATSLGCRLTPRGTVNTGNLCDTNVPRVFVAGDASRDAQFVVVAAAEGIKAAVAINKALHRDELDL
jgi:thioredoxin reductase